MKISKSLVIWCVLLIVCSILFLLWECSAPPVYIKLVIGDPGYLELEISKHTRTGLLGFGPDGYVPYKTWSWWAELDGKGPQYVNPAIEGWGGGDYQGTITLDREKNQVTINMRKDMPGFWHLFQTRAHPANGTYKIDEVKKSLLHIVNPHNVEPDKPTIKGS